MIRASVVVCSHQQAPRLRLVLRALSTQAERPLEVIVADDASTDATREMLEEAREWLAAPLVVVPSATNRGAPTTRNRGAACARGELLLFLDGDAVPSPRWIAEHVAFARAGGPPAVACGPLWHTPSTEYLADPIRGEPFDVALPVDVARQIQRPRDGWLLREREITHEFSAFAARARPGTYPLLEWAEREGERIGDARGHEAAWALTTPQNLSIPRAVFEDIGGFDERLAFFEGWELVLRARDAGLTLVRLPAAPIYHLYHYRPMQSFAQSLVRWRAIRDIGDKRGDGSLVLALLYYAARSGNALIPEELGLGDVDALAAAQDRVRREGMGPYGVLLRGHPLFSALERELSAGP